MERRRIKGNADAVFPLKDGSRTFTHTNELTITDGHIVRIKHPNVNYSNFFNLTDIDANGNDESVSSNGQSSVLLFTASAGDILSWVITPVIFNVPYTNKLNFAVRNTSGSAIVVPVDATFASVVQGEPFIGQYIFTEDTPVANLSTYHSYDRNHPYDVTWNIELYINGRRIV